MNNHIEVDHNYAFKVENGVNLKQQSQQTQGPMAKFPKISPDMNLTPPTVEEFLCSSNNNFMEQYEIIHEDMSKCPDYGVIDTNKGLIRRIFDTSNNNNPNMADKNFCSIFDSNVDVEMSEDDYPDNKDGNTSDEHPTLVNNGEAMVNDTEDKMLDEDTSSMSSGVNKCPEELLVVGKVFNSFEEVKHFIDLHNRKSNTAFVRASKNKRQVRKILTLSSITFLFCRLFMCVSTGAKEKPRVWVKDQYSIL